LLCSGCFSSLNLHPHSAEGRPEGCLPPTGARLLSSQSRIAHSEMSIGGGICLSLRILSLTPAFKSSTPRASPDFPWLHLYFHAQAKHYRFNYPISSQSLSGRHRVLFAVSITLSRTREALSTSVEYVGSNKENDPFLPCARIRYGLGWLDSINHTAPLCKADAYFFSSHLRLQPKLAMPLSQFFLHTRLHRQDFVHIHDKLRLAGGTIHQLSLNSAETVYLPLEFPYTIS
jgi:hypothetical protein